MRHACLFACAGLVVGAAAISQPVPTRPLDIAPPGITLPKIALDRVATGEELPTVEYVRSFPERIKELYDRLFKENRELKAKSQTESAQLADLQRRLREMTRPGGSLVKAYCEKRNIGGWDEHFSRNTAGQEENCGTYTCNRVSGLCNNRSTTKSSDDCAARSVLTGTDGTCTRVQ